MEELTYSGICFERIFDCKDKFFKNESELNGLYANFALYLKDQGLTYDVIYKILQIKAGLFKPEGVHGNQFIKQLIDDNETMPCYEFYNKFDSNNLFCRICPSCPINANQFYETEVNILASCLKKPNYVEIVNKELEKGPLFNSVVTDDIFAKEPDKVMPAFAIPLTRLYFESMIIEKKSLDEFLALIGDNFGSPDLVKNCVIKFVSQVQFESNQSIKLSSKKKLTDACKEIHLVFGPTSMFPPMGFVGKRKTKDVEFKKNIFDLVTDQEVKEKEINKKTDEKVSDTATAPEQILENKNEISEENKGKIETVKSENFEKHKEENLKKGEEKVHNKVQNNATPKIENSGEQGEIYNLLFDDSEDETLEITKQFGHNDETAPSKIEEVVIKNDEESQKNQEQLTEQPSKNLDEKEDNETKKEDKKEKKLKESTFVLKKKLSLIDNEEIVNIEENPSFLINLENGLINDGYMVCDIYVNDENRNFIVLYVNKYKQYFIFGTDYVKGMTMLSDYIKSQSFKIYVSNPYVLCNEFYTKMKIVPAAIYSIYRLYTSLYERKNYLLSDAIQNAIDIKKIHGNIDLFYLSTYRNVCVSYVEQCKEKGIFEAVINQMNTDILYGASLITNEDGVNYNLISFAPKGQLKCLDTDIEIINGEHSGLFAYAEFTFDNVNSSDCTKDIRYIYEQIIGAYVGEGRLKKCCPCVKRIKSNSLVLQLNSEDEYDFLYNLLVFYSRRIATSFNCYLDLKIGKME